MLICFGAVRKPCFEEVSSVLASKEGVASFILEFLQEKKQFSATDLEKELRFIAPFYNMKFQ